jgi:hypothetical protein
MDVLHIERSREVSSSRFNQHSMSAGIDLPHTAHVPAEVAAIDKVSEDSLLQVNGAKICLQAEGGHKVRQRGRRNDVAVPGGHQTRFFP